MVTVAHALRTACLRVTLNAVICLLPAGLAAQVPDSPLAPAWSGNAELSTTSGGALPRNPSCDGSPNPRPYPKSSATVFGAEAVVEQLELIGGDERRMRHAARAAERQHVLPQRQRCSSRAAPP